MFLRITALAVLSSDLLCLRGFHFFWEGGGPGHGVGILCQEGGVKRCLGGLGIRNPDSTGSGALAERANVCTNVEKVLLLLLEQEEQGDGRTSETGCFRSMQLQTQQSYTVHPTPVEK